MRKQGIWGVATSSISIAAMLGQWWAETTGIITQQNAHIILYLAIFLFITGVVILVWNYWPTITQIFRKKSVASDAVIKPEDIPLMIKDTKVKLEAEKVDRATGMEVNRPARLDNVEVDMVARDVKEATGFKTTQTNTDTGMFAATILCSCGNSFPYTSVGYRPSIVTCPHCGREHKIS
jgi:hypothetical protein